MEDTWVEDENGVRTFKHKGWKAVSYPFQARPDITGPNGEDIYFDDANGSICVHHDAPNEGATGVSIPWVIVKIAATYRRRVG